MIKIIKEKPYVYEKSRVDGVDHWTCLGRATIEVLEAETEAKGRRERDRQRRIDDLAAVAKLIDEDRRSQATHDLAIEAARLAIESAGYHRPKRNPWRRVRMPTKRPTGRTKQAQIARIRASAEELAEKRRIEAFAERRASLAALAIEANEEGDTPRGRELARMVFDGTKALEAERSEPKLYAQLVSVGDPGARSVERASGRIGGGPMAVEATRRWIETKRAEILGPEPRPTDSLIVDRILVAHLELSARDEQAASLPDDASPMVVDTLDRIRSRAERRLMRLMQTWNSLQRFRPPKYRPPTRIDQMLQEQHEKSYRVLEQLRESRLPALIRH